MCVCVFTVTSAWDTQDAVGESCGCVLESWPGRVRKLQRLTPASLGIIYIKRHFWKLLEITTFIWLACGGEDQEGGRLSLTSVSAGWSSFLTTTVVICPSPSPHLLGATPPWGCHTAEAQSSLWQRDTYSGAAHSLKPCRCSYSLFWSVLKDTTNRQGILEIPVFIHSRQSYLIAQSLQYQLGSRG